MLIGIDGNEANVSNRVGIGRYAMELLKQLFRIRNNKVSFQIYLKNAPANDLPEPTLWWKYKIIRPKPLWTQFGLPLNLFLETKKPDVFFTPSHYAPRFSPSPRVISIMDLSYFYFPELFKANDLYQLRRWTAYSINKAQKILTISESSKSDIIKHYNVSDDRVVVTYPGYDRKKFKVKSQKSKVRRTLNKYNIERSYILYVGTLQPRKNVERLIKAFNLLIKNFDEEIVKGLKLVIVGKKGWLYDKIFQRVKDLALDKKVVFTGFVNDADLSFLYNQAKCFVLPSLYEGFGLTVIEAMACGCPVVVSNVSSLPEIVGEAGIKVDPKDVTSIAFGINKVFSQKMRNKLVQKGLERVTKFSWKKCGQKTYSILTDVAERHD